MKTIFFGLLMLLSFDSMSAVGCIPGECHKHPAPRPTQPCPSRPNVSANISANISEGTLLFEASSISSNWREAIHAFTQKNLVHPSWGLAHAERNYRMTKILAEKEKVEIDLDVLYAASFLHDLGGLSRFEKAGVDHAVHSAELAEKILSEAGFPMDKFPEVKEIILGHTYYTNAPTKKAAQLFRDADVLDFLGNIGIARILAIPTEDGLSDGTLKPTLDMIKSFSQSMAQKCISDTCKEIAKVRQAEMIQFLKVINTQTFDGKFL